MILYCDSSALVKNYVTESHSSKVQEFVATARTIVVSQVGYAEVLAALYRKQREQKADQAAFSMAINQFKRDWMAFLRVKISEQVNQITERLLKKYPLKGFDAIHLASAKAVGAELDEGVFFIAYDKALIKAAAGERFKVIG